MKRRILALAAALALVSVLPLGAYAAGEEELDPVTGLPVSDTQSEEEGSAEQTVQYDYTYDPYTKTYTYSVGTGSFTANIPDGGALSEGNSVSISVDGGLTATLYRGGTPIEQTNLGNISDPGSYVLQLAGNSQYDRRQFSFTIVPELTNDFGDFLLPEGFQLTGIWLENEELDHAFANYYEFLDDGSYRVNWRNEELSIGYTLEFTLDRTPPTLALEGVVDGVATGEVSLEDLETGGYIVMETGGETRTIDYLTKSIKDVGDYVLTVYDRAGNSTRYEFTIQLYFNFSAVMAIIMLAAVVAGVVLYSRWVRKHARVG